MRRAWVVTLLSSGVAAAGCPAPSLHDVIDANPSDTAGAPATTEEPTPTSGASEGVVTTTDTPGTSGGPVEETGEASTGEVATGSPSLPPAIDDVVLDPEPLVAPGPMAVTVTTEFASKVTMSIDGGPATALAASGPDVFGGALVFQSYLSNGTHHGHFVPHSDKRPGIAVDLPFSVNLPLGGGEIFWEAIDVLGNGQVAGLAVLPDGDVVEFGTLAASAQCYLRRRRATGAWMKDGDVRVLPGSPCAAVDVAATEDGALYLLANLKGQGALSWWLGRAASFTDEPEHIGFGAPNEAAYALAQAPDRVAVCGTRPVLKDIDAVVWSFPFGKEGSTRAFDYVPQGYDDVHQFSETPRDCVFAGDRLVLAGVAYGKHDWAVLNAPYLDRLLVAEYAPQTDAVTWTVDGDANDWTTQSGTRAIAVDPQGRYLVGGYTCGKPCTATVADLRRYAPGGALLWSLELAPQVGPARALAWHPGGYVVLVSAAALQPWSSAFFVQAWRPGQYPALWSYDKNVLPTLHEATAVVIGPFGQVYTGGRGADGYPAVAFIYG